MKNYNLAFFFADLKYIEFLRYTSGKLHERINLEPSGIKLFLQTDLNRIQWFIKAYEKL